MARWREPSADGDPVGRSALADVHAGVRACIRQHTKVYLVGKFHNVKIAAGRIFVSVLYTRMCVCVDSGTLMRCIALEAFSPQFAGALLARTHISDTVSPHGARFRADRNR